jgi:hypothetical protein
VKQKVLLFTVEVIYKFVNSKMLDLNGKCQVLRRDEVREEWRQLHNEKLHNLNSLPIIIRMIKSRRRWVGHVARMREKRKAYIIARKA